MNTQDLPDILVVGAGAAGIALVCLLDTEGRRVHLLAREGGPAEDPRGIALTADVRRILEHAGVWPLLDPAQVGTIRRIEVVDATGQTARFDACDADLVALAHVVPYGALMLALGARLARAECVHVHKGALVSATWTGDRVESVLTDGTALSARLLIGADGAASTVRTLAHIAYDQQPYAEHAITATVTTSEPHAATAWQRFMPEGPVALLPLGSAYARSLIWSLDATEATRLMELDDTAFCQLLKKVAPTFGTFTLQSGRRTFPLVRGQAARYIGPRVALIGDAVHQIHPLAGQGMNLGLGDAAALADVLTVDPGADPGTTRGLRRYERWRKATNLPLTLGIDGIHWAFGVPSRPWARLRSVGLGFTERQPWLKRGLMRIAAGVVGERPLQRRSRRPR